MPLTRHFYSFEEVQSALSYCCSHHKQKEALFWTQELLHSGYASEAISTLFETWLWHVGPFRLQWLIHHWHTLSSDEIDPDSILFATYHLSSLTPSQLDHSLWNILVMRLHQENRIPDRVTHKSPSSFPSHDKKECYFIRAIFQGKALCAWWISTYLQNTRVHELLQWYSDHYLSSYLNEYQRCFQAIQQYEKLLGYRSKEYDLVLRCFLILILCLTKKQQEDSFRPLLSSMDSPTIFMMKEWNDSIGFKKYRMYSIPLSCLYGSTWRGTHFSSQHNRIELYHVEKYIIGCPFWEEAIEPYGIISEHGSILWKSDQHMEDFYETYFPDSIPDEWSHDDISPSHGHGILTSPLSLSTFHTLFFSRISRLCWNNMNSVTSYLSSHSDCFEFPSILFSKYSDNESLWKVEDTTPLAPISKIKLSSSTLLSRTRRTR
jgi:hypothetical protein